MNEDVRRDGRILSAEMREIESSRPQIFRRKRDGTLINKNKCREYLGGTLTRELVMKHILSEPFCYYQNRRFPVTGVVKFPSVLSLYCQLRLFSSSSSFLNLFSRFISSVAFFKNANKNSAIR